MSDDKDKFGGSDGGDIIFDEEIILEDMTEELVDGTPLDQLDSSIRDMVEGIDFNDYTPDDLRLETEEILDSAAELVTLFVQTHPEGLTPAQSRVFLENERDILEMAVHIIEKMLEGKKPTLRVIH
jgi:hypothetical protein